MSSVYFGCFLTARGIGCLKQYLKAREEDYLLATSDEMDEDIMGIPAYMALAENSGYLMSRGAKMLEGADAYTSSAFFRTAYGLEATRINLVFWGSPHAELADEVTTSHAETGPARRSFQHLSTRSVAVVTYSGSKVESPAGLRPGGRAAPRAGGALRRSYILHTARFSSGWKRAEVIYSYLSVSICIYSYLFPSMIIRQPASINILAVIFISVLENPRSDSRRAPSPKLRHGR